MNLDYVTKSVETALHASGDRYARMTAREVMDGLERLRAREALEVVEKLADRANDVGKELEAANDRIESLRCELGDANDALAELQSRTPGAAIVAALFPDVDATVREALGRLVEVWPGEFRVVTTDVGGGHWGFRGKDYSGGQTDWSFDSIGLLARKDGKCVRTVTPLTDPAACVAAIDAVIRRVSDGK